MEELRMLNHMLIALVVTACVVGAPAAFFTGDGSSPALSITHGVASGDVTATTAVIWARASGPARMYVEVDTSPAFAQAKHLKKKEYALATVETDFTAQLTLSDLQPNTRHFYRVWLTPPSVDLKPSEDGVGGETGTFRTAPALYDDRSLMSFTVGADVAGQQFCRNAADGGYRIFASMQALAPDFFMANGDMVYQDAACPEDGPDGPGGWQNIPGTFRSIADPSVDWTNLAQVWDIFTTLTRKNSFVMCR
jgi:alkaline phosphatase D